ncbi:neuronal PAS domain-containing protein 2 [Patella vulgata]|uniref:neuronal PAS domain-containing protein 2 n=1 Tax=Patella vulgata TaxID=6465 RepID=UPI0021804EFE|nr:neuronal PAS domain-containing protein 2 [Patella vulgata]
MLIHYCVKVSSKMEHDRNIRNGLIAMPQKKLSRNVCEKIRRDRLNALIQELAKEVPIIASCQKKLDKSSILRLTVAHLKIHFGLKKMKMSQNSWRPDTQGTDNWGQVLEEAVDGFLLVVCKKGTIILLSEAVGQLLGHNQFDLIGKDIESIIHPDDRKLFLAQFSPRCSSSGSDNGVSTRSFYVRFLNVNCRDDASYTMIHIKGQLQEMSLLARDSSTGNEKDVWLTGCGRLVKNETITNISLMDPAKDEWITQHALDGKILYTDPRISQVTGLMPDEHFGSSVYVHILPDDLDIVGRSHQKIMIEGEIPSTVFRLHTKSQAIEYVESKSCMARDKWTNQPKFIVSLNTKLSLEEGIQKLERQRQACPAISSSEAEELLSDIIKNASDLTNGDATKEAISASASDNVNSFAFTDHGDVLMGTMNLNQPYFSEYNSVDSPNMAQNTSSNQQDSDLVHHQTTNMSSTSLVEFPDLSNIRLATINATTHMDITTHNESNMTTFNNNSSFFPIDESTDFLDCDLTDVSVDNISTDTSMHSAPEDFHIVKNSVVSNSSDIYATPHSLSSNQRTMSSFYQAPDVPPMNSSPTFQGRPSILAEILNRKPASQHSSMDYTTGSSSSSYNTTGSSSSYNTTGSSSSYNTTGSSSSYNTTGSATMFGYPQSGNTCDTQYSGGAYSSVWSDSSSSVSAGSPQPSLYTVCSSPSVYTMEQSPSESGDTNTSNGHFDEFRVFSDQLQRKHEEIEHCLLIQAAEITKLDTILRNTAQYKDSPPYQKLQQRLIEIKANQRAMEIELLQLKRDVNETNEHLPHSTNQHLAPLSPDSTSLMSISESNSINGHMISSPRTPSSPDSLQSIPKGSSSSSDIQCVPDDPISAVCDGYRKLTAKERVERIKKAMEKIPAPVEGIQPKHKLFSL